MAATERTLTHYAVLYETRHGRCGVVITAPERAEGAVFPTGQKSRLGYVGCASFEEAVIRCGMMECDEPGAWGPAAGVLQAARLRRQAAEKATFQGRG